VQPRRPPLAAPARPGPVLTWGGPEAFDCGGIYPALNPIVRDGETWIYYCAQRQMHSWWSILAQWDRDRSVRDKAAGGLARMGEDRWVSLDAGARGATCSRRRRYRRFFVTADVHDGGAITAEPVTPFGEPSRD